MAAPVFEEFDPASDCECPGCVDRRRAAAAFPAAGAGGRPAAHRTVVVAAAASAVLGAGHAVPALAAPQQAPGRPGTPADDGPQTPQGAKAPLHGPGGRPADSVTLPATTRTEIIDRAGKWVAAKVPYSMSAYWSDGYRQDCSGYVSMAWKLPGNEWTGSLPTYATRITKEELQPGDMLLFHNPDNPTNGSHVVLFGGWTDYTHGYYLAYEQTRPATRRLATPYAYWTDSDRYVPYRYKGLVADPAEPGVPGAPAGEEGGGDGANPGSGAGAPPYPGPAAFGPGADNQHVTLLGRLLVERGARRFYASGPGPRWSDADRRATQAFQQAQGWRGAAADGLPGPLTWSLLTTGKGKDIAPGAAGAPAPAPAPRVPAYPGRGMFRPGADNAHVTQLGRQLVKKGFGRYYTKGPGPLWGEADRRGVEAFQRAQGWRGGAADGYPGPETWRRLFS
ncbi:peptidoglycan-binding protein [Streptomyces sp. NPDC006259]|uniref:peptidoglycan-binding protein n=1 Tax=Streptomyces sp. NPDC006259 TaxID=3364740 RepID=UPI0036AF12F8